MSDTLMDAWTDEVPGGGYVHLEQHGPDDAAARVYVREDVI